MNRDDRRRKAALDRRAKNVRKLVERARAEGYTIFTCTPEHAEKLFAIQERILGGLDDISCWDGMTVLMTMTAFVAAFGAHNRIDSIKVMGRDTFLKNCAEKYDHYAAFQAQRQAAVNSEGGDA